MRQYDDRTLQASELAVRVTRQLADAIEQRGQAVLVVAGGSTPKLFLNHLCKSEIDWSRITVIPSDERWVPADHPRSNHRFISDNLLLNRAACARLVSLYVDSKHPDEALDELETRVKNALTSIDVCVLGMGEDAHIASLFPGAEQLAEALDTDTHKRVVAITAPGACEPRISLTLALLLSARHIHLLVSGDEKLQTLDRALEPGSIEEMPVRSILFNDATQIHYAP